MAPEVRMRRPIRHQPKPRGIPVPKTTLKIRSTGQPTLRPSMSRRTLKRIPSPRLSNMNMNSANMLFNPMKPSPKLETHKLFQKINELQDILKTLIRKRNLHLDLYLSMNHSAKAYLNKVSYEDPLLDETLKLKGIKGTAFG